MNRRTDFDICQINRGVVVHVRRTISGNTPYRPTPASLKRIKYYLNDTGRFTVGFEKYEENKQNIWLIAH